MNLKKVFDHFCEELQDRTEFTSEDTIRYYWLMSMLTQDHELNHYELESPSATLVNKELDLLYKNGTAESIAVEIKFHRNPSNTTFACPDAAGSIINDLLRLQKFTLSSKRQRHLFLYVTDSEMDDYLSQRSGQNAPYRPMLKQFYELAPQASMSFPSTSTSTYGTKTFYNTAYYSLGSVPAIFSCPDVQLIGKNDFTIKNRCFQGNMCHVRLYEVIQNQSASEFVDKLGVGIKSIIEEWFEKYVTTNVQPTIVKNSNGQFLYIDVKGNVVIDNYPEAQLPHFITFNNIDGNFTLSNCHQLKDRTGFPIHITGDFVCDGCEHLNDDIIRYVEKERVRNIKIVNSKDSASVKQWLNYYMSGRAEEQPTRIIDGKIIINNN